MDSNLTKIALSGPGTVIAISDGPWSPKSWWIWNQWLIMIDSFQLEKVAVLME